MLKINLSSSWSRRTCVCLANITQGPDATMFELTVQRTLDWVLLLIYNPPHFNCLLAILLVFICLKIPFIYNKK